MFAVGSAEEDAKELYELLRGVFRSTPAIPNWSHSEGQASIKGNYVRGYNSRT